MMIQNRILSLSVASLLGVTFVSATLCEGTAEARWFWRSRTDNVQSSKQQQMINNGVATGELTRKEARKLRKKKREIARDARDKERSGGGLSYSEAEKIDRKQDKLSREIYKQSTDNDFR
ncbi:MAG: hypothetical protein SFY67_07285 [Candidatus Melainabacteria bacterium]|nr:hypothetical protein [Candidatus Melainabacteria bacterium]